MLDWLEPVALGAPDEATAEDAGGGAETPSGGLSGGEEQELTDTAMPQRNPSALIVRASREIGASAVRLRSTVAPPELLASLLS
ncbi:MAG: hypothetical protein JWN95_2576 [Frankiales bacterium]|nr:hypothetical protein [Frankiales bacterium]